MRYFIVSLCCLIWASSALAADQLVKLEWDRSAETEVTGYQLYRKSTEAEDFIAVGDVVSQVAEGTTPMTTDSVHYEPDVIYSYVVTAKGDHIESGYSNEVTVSPLRPPVLRITVAVEVTVQ